MGLRAAKVACLDEKAMMSLPRNYVAVEPYVVGVDLATETLESILERLPFEEVNINTLPLRVLTVAAARLRHPSRLGNKYLELV